MMHYEVYVDPDEGLAYAALTSQLSMIVTTVYLCWTLLTTPIKDAQK